MILFAAFWESPAILGVIAAVPVALGAWFAYRRSLPMDRAVAKTATETGQIGLITALQADNQDLRDELRALRAEHATEVRALRTDYAALKEGVELCQRRLDRVERENAKLLSELGRDNGP